MRRQTTPPECLDLLAALGKQLDEGVLADKCLVGMVGAYLRVCGTGLLLGHGTRMGVGMGTETRSRARI